MPNQKHVNKKHLAHLEIVHRQERLIRIIFIAIIVMVLGVVGYGFITNTVLLPYQQIVSINGDTANVREFQSTVKIQRIQAINRYMQYMQYAQMFGVTDPLNDQNFGPMLQADSNRLKSTDTMGQEVVDILINDRLIRQEAKKRGITVSAEEIDQALQDSFQYYPKGTPTVVPSATPAVTATLNPTQLAIVSITPTASPEPSATPDMSATPTPAPTSGPTETAAPTATTQPSATPVTADGYKTLLKDRISGLTTDTGMDETAYRRLIESSLIRQKLMDDITKDEKTTQEQVWARHILIATQAEADAVIARLKAGEDFAKVAAEVSTDASSKDKGGDLGWFAKGAMVAEFDTAVFAMKIGEISAPIKTSFGFHVIQLLGHQDNPLTEQQITTNKQTAFDAYLKTLHDAAKITINDLWKSIVPTEPAAPSAIQ